MIIIKHSYKSLGAVLRKGKENEWLFAETRKEYSLTTRSFCRTTDVPLLHHWLDTEQARRFWDDNNRIDHLNRLYSALLLNPHAASLMLCLNNEPVCLVDIYQVLYDELGLHVSATKNDYGIHFLMAPVKQRIQNLSVCCMQHCLQFLFSFREVETIYGEPDVNNINANALVQKAGFTFLKRQELSYKQANMYTCTRQAFSKQPLYLLY